MLQVIQNLGSSLTVEEEEDVSFECIADGLPPPNIVWLLNGIVVNTELRDRYHAASTVVGSSFRMGVPQATRSGLTVRDIHLSDAGEYSCRADPAVIGQPHIANTSFELTVNPSKLFMNMYASYPGLPSLSNTTQ